MCWLGQGLRQYVPHALKDLLGQCRAVLGQWWGLGRHYSQVIILWWKCWLSTVVTYGFGHLVPDDVG